MERKRIFKYIRIAIYIGIFIALLLLKYTDFISFGTCHIKENLGFLCPSCGITRATEAILSFDISIAIKYNAYYTLVLLPLFLILFLDDIICMIFAKKSFVDIILRRIMEVIYYGQNNYRYFLCFNYIFIFYFNKS